MTPSRYVGTAAVFLLLSGGAALAQTDNNGNRMDTPNNASGGATGATTGPGSTDLTSGPTGGMPGNIDSNPTNSTQQPSQQGESRPADHCDPATAAQNGANTNQNNASGGCTK